MPFTLIVQIDTAIRRTKLKLYFMNVILIAGENVEALLNIFEKC